MGGRCGLVMDRSYLCADQSVNIYVLDAFKSDKLILERRFGRSAAATRPYRQSINLESFQFRRSLFAAGARSR
jgi:hypothetical protein